MKKKPLEMCMLYDFYGELLTEKQKELFDLYYNDDLSLAEIADQTKITRQGVRDSIKRCEQQLFDFEKKLGLFRQFQTLRQGLDEIAVIAQKIKTDSQDNTIKALAQSIEQKAGALKE